MADWFAVYDLTTRALVSVATAADMAPDAHLAMARFGKVALSAAPAWTTEEWDPATLAFKPRVIPVPSIVPIVNRAQAGAVVKTLFETNPTAWTAAQEKQALYAILFLLFRDFQNGTV